MRLVAGGRVEVQKNQKKLHRGARPLNGASFDPRAPLGKQGQGAFLTSADENCAGGLPSAAAAPGPIAA
jgi:hypothetical protein